VAERAVTSEPFSLVNREKIRELLQSWLAKISASPQFGWVLLVALAVRRDNGTGK
jgi:hypothetical protein